MAELVYEMVWDCPCCGSKKLLGLTHRHCPHCGAAQDPNARYFPADHEKVAVQNHELVGADISCRYCSAPSSRRAHNCGQCGASLAEGAQVTLQVAAPASHEMAYAAGPASEPPKRPLWKVALPVAALLGVVVTVLLLVWKRDQRFVVVELSWQRSVAVERLGPVRKSAWCDELPADAPVRSRRREQRGVKQVVSGEECRTEKRDRGDGTFTQQQVCSPKHRDEPVYAEKCEVEQVEWSRAREERAEGRLETSPPYWPSAQLARRDCATLGCEREGKRSESYSVLFKDARGEPYRCHFDERGWRAFEKDARYAGKLRALVGTLDCSSLRPAR